TVSSVRPELRPSHRGGASAASGGPVEVYSLDGSRASLSAKGAAGSGTGLFIVKQAGDRRLQAVIR
ncbi:MAG: hypothetical protein ABI036_07250, partial [Fibrobacteria bacterium]